MKDRKNIQIIAALLFCVICGILAVYIFFKYLIGIFMPFIIAYIFALTVNPIAKAMSKRLGIKKKIASVILTFTLISLIIFIISGIVGRIISEGENLIEWLAKDGVAIGSSVADFFDRITSIGNSKIPLIESLMKIEQFRIFFENIDTVIANAISNYVASITKSIPSVLMNIIRQTPSAILFFVITIVSCFYFSTDIEKINNSIFSYLPLRIKEKIPEIKSRISKVVSKYTRAYLLLLILTFCELLAGFYLLKIPYPFILAFTIALVDILPVLGVGSVILPWAIIEILFIKNYYVGVGLIILYGIITVVRQITEPKIIAGSLGLHPLATLISMYSGLKLFGILGLIFGPFILLIIRSFLKKEPSDIDLKSTL